MRPGAAVDLPDGVVRPRRRGRGGARCTRGPSYHRASEALKAGGTVLDVGVGGGAASLPLAPPASHVTGVDQGDELLDAFDTAATAFGIPHVLLHGRWPDVAAEAPVADVVVCHHVLYNVADLEPFAAALNDHARRRVVIELTAEHPMARFNHLWRALHGIERPTRPRAEDAGAAIAEWAWRRHARHGSDRGTRATCPAMSSWPSPGAGSASAPTGTPRSSASSTPAATNRCARS